MSKNSAAQATPAQGAEAPKMLVVRPQEVTAAEEVKEQPKAPTIEEIKRKAELLTRLSAKYDDLIEKRKRMENFVVSHDNDTANIVLHDARGESFTSTNPIAIAQFIEFCKIGFSEAINKIENEMREIA